MYKDEYHPAVKKDLKKVDAPIREEIKATHIPTVLSDPDIGETLIGDLTGIRSYRFRLPTSNIALPILSLKRKRRFSS